MVQLNYEARAEKFDFISGQHGGYYRHDFIDHAYLYNLYFPPKAILTSLQNQIYDLVLNYPVAQDALAGLIETLIDQPAERIVVGNGAAEIIKIISAHISRKLIIPVPSFNEYVNAAPVGKVVEFPLEFPSFALDIDKFAAEAIRVEADIAVVVTPNNPTSMLVPKSDLLRLAKKLANHDCMLIIDESFLDFAQHPDQITLEPEIGRYPNIVILKSMSKAYGICGLRIGYLLTANLAFAETVCKGIPIWNINGFAEEFLRLLPDYKQEFSESCQSVRKDRDELYENLCTIKDLTVYKPDANYVFCRLPDYGLNAPEVTRKLFIEHNIYIKDCQGKAIQDSDQYIRIASRTPAENRILVQALRDVIDQGAKLDAIK